MEKHKSAESIHLPGTDLEILHFPFDPKIISALIHSVPFSIYAKDHKGTFIFANTKYCQSVGKSLKEILGKTDYDLHPEELAEKYLADDKLIMSSRKTRMIEESWQSLGGSTQYVQVVKTPLLDNLNPDKVLGTLGVFWDITEKKQAQLQIEKDRTFLRTLIDRLPVNIYVKDLKGNFIIANKTVAEFMGAESPDELIGKSDFDFYPAETARFFKEREIKLYETKEPVLDVTEQFFHKGKYYYLNTTKSPLKNHQGEIIGLIGVGHDITNIKLIEEKLRESEERYATVVSQAVEGIYLVDPVTKEVLDSNESLRHLIGYCQDELHGLKIYQFVLEDHQDIDNYIKSVSDLSEQDISETNYRHKDGFLLNVEASARLITYGEKKAILFVVRDISEKKAEEEEKERLKEQLRQAQKFEALGTLAGGVAHDLNNILAGIVSYPELMINKLPPDSDLVKPLSIIHDSGIRAATVVADLLTIARGAASNKLVYDLNLISKEYLDSPECGKLLSTYNNAELEYYLEAEFPNILCSPVHIKKCLMNLVGNACEALEAEGLITIKTTNCEIDQDDARKYGLPQGYYVLLQVTDTGSGISKQDQERIFEPFYTKKEMGRSGTGLGLTVVWNTVSDHGGTVTVESDSDCTCFSLYFPLNKAELHIEDKNLNNIEISKYGEHILIVEDQKMLRDIASNMLKDLGYKVSEVSSGEEAISFVANNPVDLLLIDMLMEPGINGRATFEQIRGISPDIKALIVSGYSEDNEVERTLQLGAKGFVQKPYSMAKLSQAIKKALS